VSSPTLEHTRDQHTADGAFALRGDDGQRAHGLVRTSRYGELLARAQGRARPYSDQSVRNYVEQGKITPADRDDKGMLFDPAKAAEDAQRLPAPTRGGAREGAGRKPAAPDDGPLTAAAERNADARDALERFADEEARVDAGGLDPGDPSRPRTDLDALVGFSPEDLERLIASDLVNTGSAELTPAKVKNYTDLLKARRLKLEIAEHEGRLAAVADVKKAWTAALVPLRNELERLGPAVSAAVVDAAWVPPAAVDRVCSLLINDGVDPDTVDIVRRELARPADLPARLAAIIDRGVERARASLAEQAQPPETTS
jgi:hypothetical protein